MYWFEMIKKHKIAIKWNNCQDIYLEWTQYDIKQKIKLCGLSFFFVQHWNKLKSQAMQLLFVTVTIEDPVINIIKIHADHDNLANFQPFLKKEINDFFSLY